MFCTQKGEKKRFIWSQLNHNNWKKFIGHFRNNDLHFFPFSNCPSTHVFSLGNNLLSNSAFGFKILQKAKK